MKMKKCLPIALSLQSLFCSALMADVSLPAIFGDNMVLQRETNAPIWGWASPGERIRVRSSWKETGEVVTSKNGTWKLKLRTPQAGGPFTITIQGNNEIRLENVMSGDVWLCSGQSNMDWPMRMAKNAKEEIEAARYPKIRMFNVAREVSNRSLDDVKGNWNECRPETVGGFSALGYFFGLKLFKNLDIPIGLIKASWGGTRIEAWTPWEAQKDFPPTVAIKTKLDEDGRFYNEENEKAKYEKELAFWKQAYAKWKKDGSQGRCPFHPRFKSNPLKSMHYPANLYNGMIHPLAKFAIKGVIWYQGESNGSTSCSIYYRKQFEALIRAWREAWNQGDFPFYFVQLPNFRAPANGTELECGWAIVREACLETAKEVPNTGMAVTIDIGEARNIHPKNKRLVADRLARLALKRTYGKDLVWSGPIYQSVKRAGNKAIITFDTGGAPLDVKDEGAIKWFALVDKEGNVIEENVDARITGPGRVELNSRNITDASMIYYAWAMNPEGVNLFNKAGLPASPFRASLEPNARTKRTLSATPGSGNGNYYALLIGNNDYAHLPKLNSAVSDVRAVANLLESEYGFSVETLFNASEEDILRKLGEYRKALTENDCLLIYYAGHGWLDKEGDLGYWLPVDAEKDVEPNWISNASIVSIVRAIQAKHVMIVADSCFAGKLTRGLRIRRVTHGYLDRVASKKARTVMTSGGVEPVVDSGGKGDHSVFASAFLDALKENEGVVDANSLFEKIRRKVVLNSDQTPAYSDIRKAGHDGGDFIFHKTGK